MSYTEPTVDLNDLSAVKTVAELILRKHARQIYAGGYNDCLCDVLNWITDQDFAFGEALVHELKKALGGK
jgi:hypothetical protein